MATQTVTRPESDQTLEKKIQRLREVYATRPGGRGKRRWRRCSES